jgi:hypothetical protein
MVDSPYWGADEPLQYQPDLNESIVKNRSVIIHIACSQMKVPSVDVSSLSFMSIREENLDSTSW